VTTVIGNGSVAIQCDTNYPFEDTLIYSIISDQAFAFYARVPTWAAGSTLSSATANSTYDESSSLQKISLPSGNSTVTYQINTTVRIENRANDTVAIYRGQVLYALYIGSEVTSTLPKSYSNQTFYPDTYAPPQSRDYIMQNTTEWNVAIDPSTLTYYPGNGSSNGTQTSITPLPTPVFKGGAANVHDC
jgi:DUF1680 family protein